MEWKTCGNFNCISIQWDLYENLRFYYEQASGNSVINSPFIPFGKRIRRTLLSKLSKAGFRVNPRNVLCIKWLAQIYRQYHKQYISIKWRPSASQCVTTVMPVVLIISRRKVWAGHLLHNILSVTYNLLIRLICL